ncbi:hypothetical protein MACH01_37100 [Thalassospira tepidiphila]|nr:hypothetical protein MACH01_37100 [Thalassospira tepidiphila]
MSFVLVARIIGCVLATALATVMDPRLRGDDGIAGDCRWQLDIVSAAGIQRYFKPQCPKDPSFPRRRESIAVRHKKTGHTHVTGRFV